MSIEIQSSERKNTRRFVWGFVGLLCCVFLGFLVYMKQGNTESRESYTLTFDNNGDGKPDTTFYYEWDIIARAEHDRNFDGKSDYWEWYKVGISSRGETDDDFDGKIDGWLTYKDGNLWFSKHDTDKNGVPDVFQHFEHSIIKIAVWRPNESEKPTRIEFYQKGVKARELRDTNGDGLLDTEVTLDGLENRVNEEKLSQSLKAEEVINGVRHAR